MLRDDDAGAGSPASPPVDEARQPVRDRDTAKPGESSEPGKDEDGDPVSTRTKLVGTIKAHPLATAASALVLVALLVTGTLWYGQARHWESTDDAFVDGRSFSVAPKVSGYILEVPITDNQHVVSGDVLARIDQRDYLVGRQQAEAQVASAEANLRSADAQIASGKAQVEEAQAQIRSTEATLGFASEESARAGELAQRGFGTVQRSQQTTSQQREADAAVVRAKAALNAAGRQVNVLEAQRTGAAASVEQAKAQLAQAELNLSYTVVTAAQPGRIVRLTGAKGQLAQAGQAIATFVPDELWLTANFKETQLADMRPGQDVEMTIDAYPGRTLKGRVDSVQPGSGTAFSLLPAQNATGNYVKVVQRVPVKIVFDALPDGVTVGPGMSVVPSVRVR